MISLTRNSLELCRRVSPAIQAAWLKSSLPGSRYASLTSAIGRAARKSAAAETSRENRFTHRSGNNSRYSPASPARGRPSKFGESRDDRFSRDYEDSPVSSTPPSRTFADARRIGNNSRYSPASPPARERPPRYGETRHGFSRDDEDSVSSKPPSRAFADTRRQFKDSDRGHSEPHWLNGRVRKGNKPGKGSGNIKVKRGSKLHRPTDEMPERIPQHVLVPASIPYTTPASEFIYGLSAVEAAIRCTRRKLYVLYIYQSADEALSSEKITLRKLALALGIRVKMAFAEWDKLLDKMSAGRPHNGCILEASPLPQLPVACLEPVSVPTEDNFNVSLSAQSVEEAAVNGSNGQVERVPRFDEAEQKRFPFVLLLDGILDPGNMGAIIRSAYYLGVDALVLTGRNSAPMTPVAIKASAGAAENMTILKAKNELDFIRRSRQNGWRFYAADSPANVADLAATNNTLVEDGSEVAAGTSILTSAPTVLMLGSEATGLMPRIKAQADGVVSIPGARIRPDLGINDAARVDSLNVSVAAAMLMEMLMRVPLQVATVSPPVAAEKTTDEAPPRSFDFN